MFTGSSGGILLSGHCKASLEFEALGVPLALGREAVRGPVPVGMTRGAPAGPWAPTDATLSRPLTAPWTAAHQAPLSMGFSRQEHWSGLPYPPPGDLPNSETEPVFQDSCVGRRVLYHYAAWEGD